MIPEQQAPLVLTAMTLRGIGSYIRGARLDIKPFTVLCGKNGSGKSTWLKVLNVLERSLRAGTLPYGYDVADWDPQNIQLTNALWHLASPEEHTALAAHDDQQAFGPPTTIGLEFEVIRDFHLPYLATDLVADTNAPQQLFWKGTAKAGTRLRLRIAHPTYCHDATETPELCDFVELSIDGKSFLRLIGDRDPLQRFEAGHDRPRRLKPYLIEVSPNLIPDLGDADAEVCRATLATFPHVKPSNASHSLADSLVLELLCFLESRVRQILDEALSSYFFIGAVRAPFLSLNLEREREADTAKRRHVGDAGERAWMLAARYAQNEMRPVSFHRFAPAKNPLSMLVELKEFDETRLSQNARLARIWEVAPTEHKSKILQLLQLHSPWFEEHLAATCPNETELADIDSAICGLLNSVLDEPGLFREDIWGEENEYRDPCDGSLCVDIYFEDREIAHLLQKGVQSLNLRELRRFNFRLIVNALKHSLLRPKYFENVEWSCNEFITYWMDQLLDSAVVTSIPNTFANLIEHRWNPSVVSGGRSLVRPNGLLFDQFAESRPSLDKDKAIARITHPCFGDGVATAIQPPRQLSSGFHQVFPIVVQVALMRWGELLAIENPEVHLHPALHLRLIEAILTCVESGRRFIVETHSDLVIRRTIRAILAEEIPQSNVQIYFADLADEKRVAYGASHIKFRGSVLRAVQVDERGRIANWPEGFLDEDARESQRLLDIMYGASNETKLDD